MRRRVRRKMRPAVIEDRADRKADREDRPDRDQDVYDLLTELDT